MSTILEPKAGPVVVMNLFKSYYGILMSLFRTVTGEEQISTWTLHKGLLRLLGMDWARPQPNISLLRIVWLLVYPVFYVLLLLSITVLTVKYAVEKEHPTLLQYTRAMNGVVASITFLYAVCKGLGLLLLGKKLRILMDMVDDLGDVDPVAQTQRDFSVRNSFIYLHLLLNNVLSWTGCSLVYMHDLPFPTDWPWGDYTPARYSFTFFVAGVAAVFCGTLHSTFDTIFPVSAGTICGHIDSMSAKLRTLGSANDREQDRRVLKECYRLHVSLIRVTNHINDTFALAFLIQSIYTVIHACVIIYQVMKVSDITLAVLNTAPMLSSSYAQFLLFCYYGELLTTYCRLSGLINARPSPDTGIFRIIEATMHKGNVQKLIYHYSEFRRFACRLDYDEFEKLRFALYNNRWYRLEPDQRKNLTVMSLVANRTVRLQSFGITFAGHKTYVSGLQDSISYYLVLKTVTTDEA